MLKLLPLFEASASQHFALWAITKLLLDYPDKYVPMIQEECEINRLQLVLRDERSSNAVKELAQYCLKEIKIWYNNI
uniref:Protein zer-1 homolog-like C-terminal domain-containing protein n=1 Tax=Acrobeloides nanus TaxID=290746 RepID=A0A914CGC1_9BILA